MGPVSCNCRSLILFGKEAGANCLEVGLFFAHFAEDGLAINLANHAAAMGDGQLKGFLFPVFINGKGSAFLDARLGAP